MALVPVWSPDACHPKKDVLEGSMVKAELAVDLDLVSFGKPDAPYDSAEHFFDATHITANLRRLLNQVLGRISGTKKDADPIFLLDADFGGGKTHSMVALYYAAKNSSNAAVRDQLQGVPLPRSCRIVSIAGDAFGHKGVERSGAWYKTLFGDLLVQLGETELASECEAARKGPDVATLTERLSKEPTLLLIDELPKYLDLFKDDRKLLESVKHFLHSLTIAVGRTEHCSLVVSVASDAYKDAADQVRKELQQAMATMSRKMVLLAPVQTEDLPKILRRRLFEFVSEEAAKGAADGYVELYANLQGCPESFRTAEYRTRVVENYPFHPELIDTLYERVSTLPRFNRTRGALRLLMYVIQDLWARHPENTILITPGDIDLAIEDLSLELTTKIGNEQMRNAIAADVFQQGLRKGKAQERDELFQEHYHAPLFRRACNAIYLYTLVGAGRVEVKGVDADTLVAILTSPTAPEQASWLRDKVLPEISAKFWYVDRIGDRFLFTHQANENKVIDQEATIVQSARAKKRITDTLNALFVGTEAQHLYVEPFPLSPSKIEDTASLKVGILDPTRDLAIPDGAAVPAQVAEYLLNNNDRGSPRVFRNDVFLLVARADSWEGLRDCAARLEAAEVVRSDPDKYGVPPDRKKALEKKVEEYKQTIHDAVRAAFTNFVFLGPGARVEVRTVRPNGYASGQPGGEVLWKYLVETLHRVVLEPLSTDYLRGEEVWPAGSEATTTQGLFEGLHRRPGCIMPANKGLFQRTLKTGVETGQWVVRQMNHVYTQDDLPREVLVAGDVDVVLIPEAVRRGWTDPHGKKCPNCHRWPCECRQPAGQPAPLRPTGLAQSFPDTDLKTLLGDLEKWARKEAIQSVSMVEIRIVGSVSASTSVRNLVRLVRSARRTDTELRVKITGAAENGGGDLSLDLRLSGDALDSSPLLKALESARTWLPCDLDSTLGWKVEKLPVSELQDLLRSLEGLDLTTLISLRITKG